MVAVRAHFNCAQPSRQNEPPLMLKPRLRRNWLQPRLRLVEAIVCVHVSAVCGQAGGELKWLFFSASQLCTAKQAEQTTTDARAKAEREVAAAKLAVSISDYCARPSWRCE